MGANEREREKHLAEALAKMREKEEKKAIKALKAQQAEENKRSRRVGAGAYAVSPAHMHDCVHSNSGSSDEGYHEAMAMQDDNECAQTHSHTQPMERTWESAMEEGQPAAVDIAAADVASREESMSSGEWDYLQIMAAGDGLFSDSESYQESA
eukprot:GDKK01069563.1.p1 GENE.GDKK01069563.1~~GDKK01069563.1.p1  ORF type:complete len:153 (+),score=23.05 GDKK01069563.1:1-459(+)